MSAKLVFGLLFCVPMWGQAAAPANTGAPKPVYQYHYEDVTIARPSRDEPVIGFSPRLAIDYMEQGALAWTGEWGCVACHTNGTYMVVRPMLAPELGAPQTAMREAFVRELTTFEKGGATEKQASQIVYIAAGLAIWDAHVTHSLSPETTDALNLLFSLQRPDGSWFVDDANNPPLESSPFQVATVAARAVANAPGWLASSASSSMVEKVDRLRKFLRAEGKMQGDYDLTDLLWASAEWHGLLSRKRSQELIAMVEAHQQIDGGWSIRTFARPEDWGSGNRADKLRQEVEYLNPPSDGHMTGLAIIALREAGVPAADPHIRSGVQWLLSNQRSSGRWWTRSLNRDGHQFISYSGTAYPLLALQLCGKLQSVQLAGAHP